MGVKTFVLKSIQQSSGEVDDYKIKLFDFWLKNAESPTWELIVCAVRELNPNLAKKLEKDHLLKPQEEGTLLFAFGIIMNNSIMLCMVNFS